MAFENPVHTFSDARGSLIAVNALQNLPFECKRIFIVTDAPAGCIRGHHAHRDTGISCEVEYIIPLPFSEIILIS